MASRLRASPNLRGSVWKLSWNVTMPRAVIPHHLRLRILRLRIPRLIIRAVDGIQNVRWRDALQATAIVAGRKFSETLRQCELKKRRQKKKKQTPSLDRPS